MAALNTIYNLVQCGLSAVLGTGTKGCKQFLKKAQTYWIVPDGFEFDGTEVLDETYQQELQAQGKLIILKGAKTFTDNSSEDVIETLEDGTKQVATLGMYEFAVTFINGLAFHAALHSLNSFGAYNILFVDRDGNILGTKANSGALKGFSLNMLQAMKLSFPSDSVGQKEGIAFQLATRREFDTDYVFISSGELGDYQPQNADGINEVVLSFDSVPTDTDTTLVVKAKNKQNANAFVGALTTDFLVTVDGVTESQTVAESPNGTYTFTVAGVSTGEAITVQLYDSSQNRAIILKDVDLYKSNIATTTVIA
tara:strand:+ start:8089 stop:9018 length:930 start_codon:yes stop_codon:yes gene_type:complete